jgi:ribosomal protein S10
MEDLQATVLRSLDTFSHSRGNTEVRIYDRSIRTRDPRETRLDSEVAFLWIIVVKHALLREEQMRGER